MVGEETGETELQALRRRVEELEEAARRKDGSLALLAHELRSPLTHILNAAYLMQNRPDPERDARILETVIQQARQMRRLIEDLLEVARATRGAIELRTEEVDVGE